MVHQELIHLHISFIWRLLFLLFMCLQMFPSREAFHHSIWKMKTCDGEDKASLTLIPNGNGLCSSSFCLAVSKELFSWHLRFHSACSLFLSWDYYLAEWGDVSWRMISSQEIFLSLLFLAFKAKERNKISYFFSFFILMFHNLSKHFLDRNPSVS